MERDSIYKWLSNGGTSFVGTLLAFAVYLLVGEGIAPPVPPQPLPIVNVDPAPAPSPAPDSTVRFIWVTDSKGFVLEPNSAGPLIEASLIESGTYAVHTLRERESVVSVTIGGDVKPDPKPEPRPEPQPVKELWGIIIEESSTRTPQHAAVLASGEIRSQFAGKLRIIDKDSTVESQYAAYVERSKGKKLPQVFLVTGSGEILFEGELPANPAEALSLVKRWKQ